MSRPRFLGTLSFREANTNLQKLFPLIKWRENMEVYSDSLVVNV